MQRNSPPFNPSPGDQDDNNSQQTENQEIKVDPPQQEEVTNIEADQGMDSPSRNNSNTDTYNRASPVTVHHCIYSGLPRLMRIGVPRGNNIRLNYVYKLPFPPFGPNMMHSQPPVQYQQQPNPYLHNQYDNTYEYPAYSSMQPQEPLVPPPEPLVPPPEPLVPPPEPPIDLYNPINQPYPTCFNLRPEQAQLFQQQVPLFQHQAPPFQHQAPPFQHQAPPFQHQAPPFQHQAPPFQHQAASFLHQVPYFQHQAPPFQHQASPFQHQAPPFQHQAPPFQHQAPPFQHQAPPFQYQAPPFQHAEVPFKYDAPPVKYEVPVDHYTPHTNPPTESSMNSQAMDFNAQEIPQRRRATPSRRDYEDILNHTELRPGAQEFVPRQNEARRPMDGQHFLRETGPVQTTGQAHHNQLQDTNAELIKAANEERKQACSSRSVPVVRYIKANNVERKPKKNGYKQFPHRVQNLNKTVPKSTDTGSLNKNVDNNKKVKKRSRDNQTTNDLLRSGNLGPQNPKSRRKPLILRKTKQKQSNEKEKPLSEESDDLPGPLFKICRNTGMARVIPNPQKEKQKHSTDTNIQLEVSLNDIPKLKPVDNVIIEIYDDNKLTVIEENPVFDKETLIVIEGKTNVNNKFGMGTSTSNNNQALTNDISDFQLAEPVSCDGKQVSSEINPRNDKDKPAILKTKPSCNGTAFFCNKPSVSQNDKLDCDNDRPDSNTDGTTISSEIAILEMVLNITASEEQNLSGINTEGTAAQHNEISNVTATQSIEIYKAPVVSEGIICKNNESGNEGLKLLQDALEILENQISTAREVVVRTGRPLDPLLLLDIIAHDPQVQDFITGTPFTNNGKDGGSSYNYYRLTDFQLCHLRHIPDNKLWGDYILDQKMLTKAGGPEAMPERKDELEAFSREIIIEALRRRYNVQDVESLRLCVIYYLRKYPEYRLTLLEKLVKNRQNKS